MPTIDRSTWLKEKRRLAEERMDTLWAPIYDQNWGATIDPTHERFLHRFLDVCPPQAVILDAACGTGKYWPPILASGRTIFGMDQSQGMLNRAQAKYPDVPTEKVEVADENEIEQAFSAGQALGLPVVYGEWADEEGYHYYPRLKQVNEWVQLTGFHLVDETFGDLYQHYLVQKPQ